MEGHVYLIAEESETENLYKIGVTRQKNIKNRVKQLQTGNGKKLQLVEYFISQYPYKVEKMLHLHFHENRVEGEWFSLSQEQVDNFISICQNKEEICECLKDNPFFNPIKKSKHY